MSKTSNGLFEWIGRKKCHNDWMRSKLYCVRYNLTVNVHRFSTFIGGQFNKFYRGIWSIYEKLNRTKKKTKQKANRRGKKLNLLKFKNIDLLKKSLTIQFIAGRLPVVPLISSNKSIYSLYKRYFIPYRVYVKNWWISMLWKINSPSILTIFWPLLLLALQMNWNFSISNF